MMADQQIARESAWERILDLTRIIRDKAAAGQWEECAALDSERLERLESFFSTPPGSGLARRVSEDILYILESDRQVEELVRQMRTAFDDELRSLRRGHKAANAYLEQSGE